MVTWMTQPLVQLITKSLVAARPGHADALLPVSLVTTLSTASDLERAELRDRIFAFQDAFLAAIERGEVEEKVHTLPLEHSFIDGAYARTMTIPAGMVIIGKIHRFACFNAITQGRMSVLSEYGMKEVCAPAFFSSPAGIKRVGYAHETTVWTTIHPNAKDLTDLDALEEWLTVPGYHAFDPETDCFPVEAAR